MEVALDFQVVVGLDVDPEPVVHTEALDRRKAASVVMDRLPRMTWLIRVWGSPVGWASPYCVMPRGSRNSVSRVSPGVIERCARAPWSWLRAPLSGSR